jgi:MYXO-CTERM domain-containing protein
MGEGGEPTGGRAPEGGSNTGARGGTSPTSGTTGNAGGEGGGANDEDRDRRAINTDSTCGCRVPGKETRGTLPALLVLLLGLATLRRRRSA